MNAMNPRGFPTPPFDTPQQTPPGASTKMHPEPDHGEDSYRGSGKLQGKKTLITGADSGIGRAVALAYAREGADVAIVYLSEDDEAKTIEQLVRNEGRDCIVIPTDISKARNCKALVEKVVKEFGWIDVLVNNAAHQASFEKLEDISDEEWDLTFATNISAMFYITKAALPHMRPGSAIINTASINADSPSPNLLPYATTKGAIQNFTAGLAQLLAERGIRANAVAPGPVWTPLIPSTMPPDKVRNFGKQVPMGRPAQPAELAPPYVMLASDEASYISGATIAVTGGKPII